MNGFEEFGIEMEAPKLKQQLTVELVPASWGNNLRKVLPKKDWESL